MTSTILNPMAWTNERLKFSCSDSSGLKKVLLKMMIVDNGSAAAAAAANNSAIATAAANNNNNNLSSPKNNKLNGEKLATLLAQRGIPSNMSLLKFFAINALELSAPASPVFLEQSNSKITPGWLQLSGHPQSIAPVAHGIVRKRVTNLLDSEVIAYRGLTNDPFAVRLIPKFMGVRECPVTGDTFIELQDLLHDFKDPHCMDIKMGCRTFLESEVTNQTLRPDLYKKMVTVDALAPNDDEHLACAVTKLRYMLFREQMSSSQTKGFRIEALKMSGTPPITDLKTIKSGTDVRKTIASFLANRRTVIKELIKRLKLMRTLMEKSNYFQTHEIVGSSIFIVYDDRQVGAWLIDFAKARTLPDGHRLDHRRPWMVGNREEGLLHGMDELIKTIEEIYATTSTKCGSGGAEQRKCARR